LLRTSVSAAHSSAEIEFAIDMITEVGIELGVIQGASAALLPAAQ